MQQILGFLFSTVQHAQHSKRVLGVESYDTKKPDSEVVHMCIHASLRAYFSPICSSLGHRNVTCTSILKQKAESKHLLDKYPEYPLAETATAAL
jgi:hypothetical protein